MLIVFLPALLFESALATLTPSHPMAPHPHTPHGIPPSRAPWHPTLTRRSAFAMDVGMFWNLLPQIVTMAFPSVVVASLLTGGLIQLVCPVRVHQPWAPL